MATYTSMGSARLLTTRSLSCTLRGITFDSEAANNLTRAYMAKDGTMTAKYSATSKLLRRLGTNYRLNFEIVTFRG